MTITKAGRRTCRWTGFGTVATLGAIMAATVQAQGPGYTEWGDTVPLLNVSGGCPFESQNGRRLYTASGRDGTLDIFVYDRMTRSMDFEGPTKLGSPVSQDDADDFCPSPLLGDWGNWLMFVSDRATEDACGGADIYMTRLLPGQTGHSGDARHLACAPDGPNTSGTELSPDLVTTWRSVSLYYSSDVDGDQDIYRSTMAPDGTFGAGVAEAGLNTDADDRQPNLSRDGLEIVFASNRDGNGQDIFTASRPSLNAPWSTPRNLTVELDLPTVDGNETRPSLSWDGRRLYYGSGGTIYVSTRTRVLNP